MRKCTFQSVSLTILIFASLVLSQNDSTIINKYEALTLLPQYNGFKPVLHLNHAKLSHNEVKEISSSFNETQEIFDSYRKLNAASRIFLFSGIGMGATALFLIGQNDVPGEVFSALMVGGLVSICISIPFEIKRTNKLYKLSWTYNKLLLPELLKK